MRHLPDFIQDLINQFDKLPGIGPKTAARLVFNILHRKEDMRSFAESLQTAHDKVHFCRQCFNLSDDGLCNICSDSSRDQTVICIVAHPQDIDSIEKTGQFNGVYHLLSGLLSPLEGITPDRLKINQLISRVETGNIKEVIIALDQSMEGETTTLYLTKLLKKYPPALSILGRGLPMGANIEYTDEVTLSSAIQNRKSPTS